MWVQLGTWFVLRLSSGAQLFVFVNRTSTLFEASLFEMSQPHSYEQVFFFEIFTSSAEAELYAAGRGGCEALGVQSYLQDLGWQRDVAIRIDSSATLCLLNRTGLGRAKHIEIQHLWLQEAVKLKRLSCAKVLGHDNPADLMTKALSFDRITYLAEMLGCRFA